MVRASINRGHAARTSLAILACAVLLLAGVAAEANPRFIAASRVNTDAGETILSIRFNCKVGYLRHTQVSGGDQVRIELDPTSICNGTSPLAAQSRARLRPANADAAHLVDIEYDGESPAGPTLVLNFSEPVTVSIADSSAIDFRLDVRIDFGATASEAPAESERTVLHRQVVHETGPVAPYIINLASFRRIPTIADAPDLSVQGGQRLFYSEALIDGVTWYRLRLGDFASAQEARAALPTLGREFPDAWIDQRTPDSVDVELIGAAIAAVTTLPEDADEVDRLMAEARREMVSGNSSRAIQLYTKVLQMPPHSRHPEAQEFLAVAREKQGQLAHAKAEYQRYLSLYPNSEGAGRVSQRLAALLAGTGSAASQSGTTAGGASRGSASDWRIQTYASQYYRRDVNQPNDQDEIVSQSALYSDINFDARRRGERFDFSARLSAGYRSDFLSDDEGSGNETRVSYAYADIDDAVTGIRARLGRQSRNTGGVLGRFDGLNIGYQATERILLSSVVGKPAYSASDGVDSARSFIGASVNYGPVFDGLELGGYFIQQTIEGIDDRQAVGFEFRYFGENQSIWGLVDYDTSYAELSSAFLQTNWRLTDRLSMHGSIDRRRSPFLSTGNALIGQPVQSFADLAQIFSEDELHDLALDRSPESTSYSLGIAHSLTPNLQVNADASWSDVEATPDSGGVFGAPGSQYNYLSTSVVASSLFREGDVMIVSARHSDSGTAKVATLTFDGRFPFRSGLRINPRLRVDRRERVSTGGYEWIYTPGLRIQYRWSRRFRIQFEAGKQFSQQDVDLNAPERDSYFVNIGYQAFF